MKKLTIFILALVMTIMCSVSSFAADGQDGHTLTGKFDSAKAFEVLDKVNAERKSAGLSPLTMDKELLEAAKIRAAECAVEFSHTRPNGENCFTVCSRAFGENIASGQTSAAEVMNSWMNSSGHRANILDSDFTSIGVGCFLGTAGEYEWVQLFGVDNDGGTAVKPSTSVSTETVFISMSAAQSDANNYFVITDKTYTDMPDERPSDLIQATVGQTKSLHIYTYSEEEYGGYLFVYMQEFNRNSFTWKSSDTSVATVDSNGNVKIVGGGTCDIYAYGGTIKRGHVTIEVPADLKITTQPKAVSVAAGEKATFTIAATGNGLTYQWQYKNPKMSAFANTGLAGNKTNTLSFNTTEAFDGIQFRCIVTDKNGKSVTSSTALLTVLSELKITTQPKAASVAAGQKVTFKVAATGSGLTYQWQYKNPKMSSFANTGLAGNKTDTLSFTPTAAYDGIQFRCIVKDKNGNSVTSSTALLTVLSELKITTQPKAASVAEGQKVTFKIAATGNGLTYQWQYKNPKMSSFANTGLAGNKTDTLSFTPTAAYDGIQFRCIVKDKNGKSVTSSTALLTVLSELKITTQPKSAYVTAGQKVTFKVAATGNGLTYQWQYKNSKMSSFANTGLAGNKTDTLSFNATEAFNGIQFRCIVTDKSGDSVKSNIALLTVD